MHEGAQDADAAFGTTIDDTTDRQRLQETCHDMRQALGGVFALAGAALSEPGLPETARVRLEQIVGQAQWLADMIQECLRAGPDDAGTRLLDLSALADEAAAAERVTYAGQIELTWPAAPVLTLGSRVTIRRVIANLLSNASRAAGPGGRVRIETGYDQDQALLAIDDSGPGFGRIPPGSGLGLRTVARATLGCGGRLEYDRSPLGGVQVRLRLPVPDGWAPVSRGFSLTRGLDQAR